MSVICVRLSSTQSGKIMLKPKLSSYTTTFTPFGAHTRVQSGYKKTFAR